ncbi:hypothetical protein JQN72_16675 [Phycicoccus sp. CSK15P-2]|uniref:hypothetical protein n=1 Tax=Phycicoccus sp. CSK15P-2 TaxID=2807627 RepID=UPI00194E36F6|nr:hypothetical protein [Phycicoccus sp. CSK15P-2]MBM6405879.1 hypothetical protein [Phycicoccus sp. CSK15P-2]
MAHPRPLADVLERLIQRALEAGELGSEEGLDDPFVRLMDATTSQAAPAAPRLLAILEARGRKGWTRIERVTTG